MIFNLALAAGFWRRYGFKHLALAPMAVLFVIGQTTATEVRRGARPSPRRLAVDIFAQCVDAGVGAVSFFTSGFGETDDEGVRLQHELADMSLRSGVPLFGPNCTGVYNPIAGICSSADMPVGELGPVGMVRFLQQFEQGRGDYSRERLTWQGPRSVQEIASAIQNQRHGEDHDRPV